MLLLRCERELRRNRSFAVVDPELRVHGILGLRVAEGITDPGTNASTHMIAGRAAQLVLG